MPSSLLLWTDPPVPGDLADLLYIEFGKGFGVQATAYSWDAGSWEPIVKAPGELPRKGS